MRRWFRRGREGGARKMEPVPVLEHVRGLEGKWVAMKDGRVIRAADSFDKLYEELSERSERGASIFRVPAEGEPEPVGLG